jgi:hypothetical protein
MLRVLGVLSDDAACVGNSILTRHCWRGMPCMNTLVEASTRAICSPRPLAFLQALDTLCKHAVAALPNETPESALGLCTALLQHGTVPKRLWKVLWGVFRRYGDAVSPRTLCLLLAVLGTTCDKAGAVRALTHTLSAVHAQASIFSEQDWCDLWSACAKASTGFSKDGKFKCAPAC